MSAAKKYWLMKSEPETFSIDQLAKVKKSLWDGVRNYQARNYMMEMAVGDEVLFYHSNAEPPGVAGLAVVSGLARPDASALDKKGLYYDAKASKERPIWHCVEVQFVKKFARLVSLEELKTAPGLSAMVVTQKGSRLSVQPVTAKEFSIVCKMSEKLTAKK